MSSIIFNEESKSFSVVEDREFAKSTKGMKRALLFGGAGAGTGVYLSGKVYDQARAKGLSHAQAKKKAMKVAALSGAVGAAVNGVGTIYANKKAGLGLSKSTIAKNVAINAAIASAAAASGANARTNKKYIKDLIAKDKKSK